RERFNLIAAGLYEASTLLGVCEPRNTPLLHLPLRKCSDGLSAFLQTRSQSPPVSEPAAIHGGPPRQQSCEPGPMFGAAKLGKMGADRIDHCGLLAWTPPVGNSPKAHKTMARSHDRPVVLPPGRARRAIKRFPRVGRRSYDDGMLCVAHNDGEWSAVFIAYKPYAARGTPRENGERPRPSVR